MRYKHPATLIREHIDELEAALRAAKSFIEERHTDADDGHATLVLAVIHGALGTRVKSSVRPLEETIESLRELLRDAYDVAMSGEPFSKGMTERIRAEMAAAKV